MKNKIIALMIIVLMIVLNINVVYGSFADFTDEQADKQAQEQIKEQEKEHNVTQVKSSDNYLTGLQVEGFTLTPEFDKQTLEYTIKEEINKNEINIKATTSNEKATISGTGIVKIEDGKNDYRIDVTAENGTVRTYIIKLKVIEKKEQSQENILEDNKENEKNVITIPEEENKNIEQQNKQDNKLMYLIIGISIIVVIIILIILKKSKKNGKRYR